MAVVCDILGAWNTIYLNVQSVTGKSVPIFTKDLLGQGEIVGCADTGIDMDVIS